MACRPHEEQLLTLYADVHYYFSEPTPRPLHHRFDKASYVYLYRDTAKQRARLEIANHAGSPEQDAFTGYLDYSQLSQENKHPTLCTIIVDGAANHDQAPADEEHDWRLPSTDPRDEGKYLFRLHTIDLYFWAVEDAYRFASSVRSVLPQEQIFAEFPPEPEPMPEPEPENERHAQLMSPVVQQLENVAIHDQAFQTSQGRNRSSVTGSMDQSTKAPDAAAFTPLPYNPAAPPAPEVIKAREKTPPPPPPEGVQGTGLAAAAYHDQGLPLNRPVYGSAQPPSGHGSYSPSGIIATSPTTSQGQRTSISSYPPGRGSISSHSSTPQNTQVFSGPPSANTPTTRTSTTTPMALPPKDVVARYSGSQQALDSPAAEILGDSYIQQPQQPLQHLQPQYPDYLPSHSASAPPSKQEPLGGFSEFKYEDPQHSRHGHHQHQAQDDEYAIHSQVYRPTEEEYSAHGKHKRKNPNASKLEQKSDKAEGSVNRFLKKLEKKIG